MSKIKKAAAPKKPRPTARGSRGPKLKKKLLSLEKKKAPNTNPRNKKLPLKNKRAVENEPQPVHDEPQEAQEPPQEVRSELDDDVSDAESSNLFEDEIDSHKKSLSKLADTDPEFYKFLRDNDKRLLDFDVSDSEDDDEKQEDAVHTPGEGLEVASDESDFEVSPKYSFEKCFAWYYFNNRSFAILGRQPGCKRLSQRHPQATQAVAVGHPGGQVEQDDRLFDTGVPRGFAASLKRGRGG